MFNYRKYCCLKILTIFHFFQIESTDVPLYLRMSRTLSVYEYKCSFNSVIINTLYQLCPLADEFKQIRGKTIASKKLAWEKGKEEWEELGGMILSAPPVLSLQKRPWNPKHMFIIAKFVSEIHYLFLFMSIQFSKTESCSDRLKLIMDILLHQHSQVKTTSCNEQHSV